MLFSSVELTNLNNLNETASLLNELSSTFTQKKFEWKNSSNNNVNFSVNDLFVFLKKIIPSIDKFLTFHEDASIEYSGKIRKINKDLSNILNVSDEVKAKRLVNIFYKFSTDFLLNGSYLEYLNDNNFETERSYFSEFITFINYVKTTFLTPTSSLTAFGKIQESKPNLADYNFIDRRIDKIEEKLNKHDVNISFEVQKHLTDMSDKYNESAKVVIEDFEGYIESFKKDKIPSITTEVEALNTQINEARAKLVGLVGSLNQYESIISENTENEISKHYAKKAKREKRAYWWATAISIAIILISLFSAWCGLNDYYHSFVIVDLSTENCKNFKDLKVCAENIKLTREATEKFGLIYLIMRLIFSFFLFLTVIYTSRIAIRAYSHWRHSENMHLKLASLRPFINDLDPTDIEQIHKDLVPDYFGKDAGLVDTANEKFKDLPANVSAVAMKAIEQISGSGSNSSTEKNNKKPESETG